MRQLLTGWPPRAEQPTPPGADIAHLWSVALDVSDARLRVLAETLTEAERERAARLLSPLACIRWIAARGSLRELLGAYLDCPPAAVAIDSDELGKPYLRSTDSVPPHFSVSRSRSLMLVGLTRSTPIGVDVEAIDRPQIFLEHWTAKEAYLKAIGVGLRQHPPRVDLKAPMRNASTEVELAPTALPAPWLLARLAPCDGYVGAAVVNAAIRRFSCHRWP